jgi:hypothetical protein
MASLPMATRRATGLSAKAEPPPIFLDTDLSDRRQYGEVHMWTAPSSQGVLQCFDQIACAHMSGLLARSHMNAGQDGFRDRVPNSMAT